MQEEQWEDRLRDAQQKVADARGELTQVIRDRDQLVHQAQADGMTMYRIAKILDVTQAAVRKILGLRK